MSVRGGFLAFAREALLAQLARALQRFLLRPAIILRRLGGVGLEDLAGSEVRLRAVLTFGVLFRAHNPTTRRRRLKFPAGRRVQYLA